MNRRTYTTGVLIVACLFLLTGMGRRIDKDLSHDPAYSWIIGKGYQTKADFVLFQFSRKDKKILVTEFGDTVPEREEIGDVFPYEHEPYGRIIWGVLPAGSVFRVKRVKEEGQPSLTFIRYHSEIIFSENKPFIGVEINPTALTNMSDPPRFDPRLVAEADAGDVD